VNAWWIVDQLVAQGVRRFCIAPGSRNSPLVIAAAKHSQVTSIVHYDERGLAFYALGYGKGAKEPAAIIATSGTAVAHFLAAIMEAHHGSVPLIVLTADRPSELRDCGANQTTDQVKIFSSFLRFEVDAPPTGAESYFRSIAAQSVWHAMQNPKGPVQINCQFRDPLHIENYEPTYGSHLFTAKTKLIAEPIRITQKKGVILLGDIGEDPMPVLKLAERLQWPVFADILSNARLHPTPEQINHFPILQHPETPEFVLHFGEPLLLGKWKANLHIGISPFLKDPLRALPGRVQSDIASFCEQFEAGSDPDWLESWQKLDQEAKERKRLALNLSSFTEPHAMDHLSNFLSPNVAVFLGNGMPIRDGTHFLFPEKCRGFFGNRGLSGIDGNIAMAAGISDGLDAPLLAFIGDQATLHDLNSLPFLHKTKHPITLIVSNNFGGGIFSHLPIANTSVFQTYIAAEHNITFEHAAALFKLPHLPFDQLHFHNSAIFELQTCRKKNHQLHQQLTPTK
jgi:2-succinyl-5-enolpyruvyl-6-hydroxy-3-cyclohexene-1-carboxylate synthase